MERPKPQESGVEQYEHLLARLVMKGEIQVEQMLIGLDGYNTEDNIEPEDHIDVGQE